MAIIIFLFAISELIFTSSFYSYQKGKQLIEMDKILHKNKRLAFPDKQITTYQNKRKVLYTPYQISCKNTKDYTKIFRYIKERSSSVVINNTLTSYYFSYIV